MSALVALFLAGCSGTVLDTDGPAGRSPGVPDLGRNANLNGKRVFPLGDPWNTPVDSLTVDPNSANLISSIGLTKGLHPDFGANWNGGPFGIPYVVVKGTTVRAGMTFGYADESDPGPYPFPFDAPIEGGPKSDGDRHVIVIDRDNWRLYETYDSHYVKNNTWVCGSGAVFDLTTDTTRPAGWTSADAAGLPIFPGLARYEEVSNGLVPHALRFTVARTRRAYVAPARHFASNDTGVNRPPMGMRVRLKSSFVTSSFPSQARVILDCLKRYGMIVADNGSDWFVSGAPDPRWDDEALNTLKSVQGSNFEVVQMGPITVN